MKERKPFIAVVDIHTMRKLYFGRSVSIAAQRLVPGTCYVFGDDATEVSKAAIREAERFKTGVIA